MLRPAAAVLSFLALGAVLSAGELRVVIHDARGQPVPAAVRLLDARGALQVPDAALDLSGMGYHYQAGDLIHYADWTSTRVRTQDPLFGSSYFRQKHTSDTDCFFVTGGFRLPLAPGTYRLVVSKGLEYTVVDRPIAMSNGDDTEDVTMNRWVDMAARGWYSGDDHVHIERATPAANAGALAWAAAEDLHVANVLWMGDAEQTYYQQYAYGPAGRAHAGTTWLVPGQEEPRTGVFGHTLHLNTPGPLRDAASYYAYGPIFERNHGHGLSGFAHVGRRRWSFDVGRALTLLAPGGLADFVEVCQMGYIGTNLWYEFLNLGFHLTAMAGNDVPWGGTIGGSRVYAYTGKRFDPDLWFDAVRAGHTFVTTGPMLELTVNGQLPGTVLRLKQGDPIHVVARAWGQGRGAVPVRLKLVSFGRILKECAGEGELDATLSIPASDSCWITAVVETNREPLMDLPGFFTGAVATPVYVEVNGAPTCDNAHLAELVGRRLQAIDQIEALLRQPTPVVARGAAGGRESQAAFAHSIPDVEERIRAARAYYSGLQTQRSP